MNSFTQPAELRALKRDLLTIEDLSVEEIKALFASAKRHKELRAAGRMQPTLAGKTLAMIFEKPSTRTRVGFEVAMTQLGGHAINLSPDDTQMGRHETIADTARILAGYCDCILIRTFGHDRATELAKYSRVPIINGLTDLLHPCQILSDMFTIEEKLGKLAGVKVAYVGDGNNIANSWIIGASKMGINLTIACPEDYEPDEIVLKSVKGRDAGITVLRDPMQAVGNANVIYTDTWASMGQEAETENRRRIFAPYAVNAKLVSKARPDVMVMHCLPAHRGDEISDEVADGPNSIIFPQAENRLHVQKAILEFVMGVAAR